MNFFVLKILWKIYNLKRVYVIFFYLTTTCYFLYKYICLNTFYFVFKMILYYKWRPLVYFFFIKYYGKVWKMMKIMFNEEFIEWVIIFKIIINLNTHFLTYEYYLTWSLTVQLSPALINFGYIMKIIYFFFYKKGCN